MERSACRPMQSVWVAGRCGKEKMGWRVQGGGEGEMEVEVERLRSNPDERVRGLVAQVEVLGNEMQVRAVRKPE